MCTVNWPVGAWVASWLMPRYKRPDTGTVKVLLASTTKGVAASLSPMRPTSAPRPALGTIRGRTVSAQPRCAPAGVMPVSLPMLTVPVAVMCSLSPALTSILVSFHFGLPLTVTLALVALVALAAAAVAGATCQKGLLVSAAIKSQDADFMGPEKLLIEYEQPVAARFRIRGLQV